MTGTYNRLTRQEIDIIEKRGTEYPFSGQYDGHFADGTYICRRCNNPLFSSQAKFDAGCGWPAFDDCFPSAVEQLKDSDGTRIEIRCNNCKGHLGHVFFGEHFNDKETRHCVNSLSIRFIPQGIPIPDVLTKP